MRPPPPCFHSPSLWGLDISNDRFPEPNNARRKLRSIACARQIGISASFPHLRAMNFLPHTSPNPVELTSSRTLPTRRLEETRLLVCSTTLIVHGHLCNLANPFLFCCGYIHGLNHFYVAICLCICMRFIFFVGSWLHFHWSLHCLSG